MLWILLQEKLERFQNEVKNIYMLQSWNLNSQQQTLELKESLIQFSGTVRGFNNFSVSSNSRCWELNYGLCYKNLKTYWLIDYLFFMLLICLDCIVQLHMFLFLPLLHFSKSALLRLSTCLPSPYTRALGKKLASSCQESGSGTQFRSVILVLWVC